VAHRIVLLPHDLGGNIYLDELGQAYRTLGWDVVYANVNFHRMALRPDLLHIHWPEELYRWSGTGSVAERAQRFVETIDRLKASGSRIAWTVHNLAPHEAGSDESDELVFRSLLARSDVVVHHCPHSVGALRGKYAIETHAVQIVVPHGHYFAYPNRVSRQEARARLGIPADAFVYLHFGAIRGYKGVDRLLSAFGRARVPNKFLLVAGRYQAIRGKGAMRDLALLARMRYLSRSIKLMRWSIASEDVQLYLQSASAVVLSHTHGLNSGVAVLGMTFGKPVIGPDMGCIAWVLGRGMNVVYDPSDEDALVRAMERAPSLDAARAAEVNRDVARQWQWQAGAKAILDAAWPDECESAPRAPLTDAGDAPIARADP